MKVLLGYVSFMLRKHNKYNSTVRAGIMGQISTLTHDCGVIEFLRTLLSREDWLILI
jgi:hypothetical protein